MNKTLTNKKFNFMPKIISDTVESCNVFYTVENPIYEVDHLHSSDRFPRPPEASIL